MKILKILLAATIAHDTLSIQKRLKLKKNRQSLSSMMPTLLAKNFI